MSGETLYELGEALERAFEEIDAELSLNDGEYTPEMAARLDAAEMDWEAKVERVALYVRSLSAQVLGIAAEEARLKKRRLSVAKRADWLKDAYLRHALEAQGRKEVARPLATVRIQDNPPSVVCSVPLASVPPSWLRGKPVEYALDKLAVLAAHARGDPLPEGISVERGKSVRVV